MALELWFREDARHALLTVTLSTLQGAVANGTPNVSYVRGVLDSARGACVAFGVDFVGFVRDLRALLASRDVLGVLEAADAALLAPGGREVTRPQPLA